MPSIAYNKSSLKHQRDQLKMFKRFLPSLDLKRQQLLAECKKTSLTVDKLRAEADVFGQSLEGLYCLLGASRLDLTEVVKVRTVDVNEENRLGVKLPVLVALDFAVSEYSTLARPFWVDRMVTALKQMASLKIEEQILREQVKRLEEAVRRITQRVNLFEKVLIPRTQRIIQKIAIYLADLERAAVVRSKIAKAKHRERDR